MILPDEMADDADDLTLKGSIETSSVPDLICSVLRSGESGVLTLRRGDLTKKVFLHAGRIIYSSSTNPDERLGEVLLVRGRITPRQYLEASKTVGPGRRMGMILVEMNALETEDLIPAVEQQVRGILADVFSWTQGEYELDMRPLSSDVTALNIASEKLVLESIRQSRSWGQVLRGITSIEAVFTPTGNTDVLYKLDLTPEEQEILQHFNGRATVEQVCEVSYLTHFETCRLIWAFQLLGLIRRGQAGEAEQADAGVRAHESELDLEGIVEKFNQMFGRIYVFLQGRHGDGVDGFMDACMEEACRQFAVLFDGVDLKHYGRADYEQMLANVADLPAEQRRNLIVGALNEMVFIMQLMARQRHGAEEEAVVTGIIKDGLRRLKS